MKHFAPMFIALTGAQDRAVHEGKTVGVGYCRASLEVNTVLTTDGVPSEEERAALSRVQENAMLIIRHTLTVMANEMAVIMGGPIASTVTPDSNICIVNPKAESLAGIRERFVEGMDNDETLAAAQRRLTAFIVGEWQ